MQEDLVAIARLRGQTLRKLDIPACCIASLEGDDEDSEIYYDMVDDDFCEEVGMMDHVIDWSSCVLHCLSFLSVLQISQNLGQDWRPIPDECLHPAITDMLADAETVYLSTLQEDQTC